MPSIPREGLRKQHPIQAYMVFFYEAKPFPLRNYNMPNFFKKSAALMKKNKPGKIPQCNFRLIDGQENRGQACRQGRVATSKPPLNNQLPVGRKVIGRVGGS